MKVEQEKSGLYIKGSAEVYHSVTYLYGYQRFFGFSVDGSYYKLEEKQDEESKTTNKLWEVSKEDFDAMMARFCQMTKHWRSKKNQKICRDDYCDQVVEFYHGCKKQLCLRKNDVSVFTENSFKQMLDSIN